MKIILLTFFFLSTINVVNASEETKTIFSYYTGHKNGSFLIKIVEDDLFAKGTLKRYNKKDLKTGEDHFVVDNKNFESIVRELRKMSLDEYLLAPGDKSPLNTRENYIINIFDFGSSKENEKFYRIPKNEVSKSFKLWTKKVVSECDSIPSMGENWENYQHDADIIRLRNLKTIWGYIKDFKEQTGEYPLFRDVNLPVEVDIASAEQMYFIDQSPVYSRIYLPCKDLEDDLKKGLGVEIKIPYDPQIMPDVKPTKYLYKLSEGHAYLAVHVHQKFSFSRKISKGYNKIEVSDESYSARKIHKAEKLFNSKRFRKEIVEPMINPERFE